MFLIWCSFGGFGRGFMPFRGNITWCSFGGWGFMPFRVGREHYLMPFRGNIIWCRFGLVGFRGNITWCGGTLPDAGEHYLMRGNIIWCSFGGTSSDAVSVGREHYLMQFRGVEKKLVKGLSKLKSFEIVWNQIEIIWNHLKSFEIKMKSFEIIIIIIIFFWCWMMILFILKILFILIILVSGRLLVVCWSFAGRLLVALFLLLFINVWFTVIYKAFFLVVFFDILKSFWKVFKQFLSSFGGGNITWCRFGREHHLMQFRGGLSSFGGNIIWCSFGGTLPDAVSVGLVGGWSGTSSDAVSVGFKKSWLRGFPNWNHLKSFEIKMKSFEIIIIIIIFLKFFLSKKRWFFSFLKFLNSFHSYLLLVVCYLLVTCLLVVC